MDTLRRLLVVLLALSLSGCAMFKKESPGGFGISQTDDQGEWECTGSRENGDWDCQRIDDSENALAILDQDPIDSATQTAGSGITQTRSLAHQPVTVHSYDPNAGIGTQTIDVPTSSSNSRSAAGTDEPEYLWLSYRPSTPTRIEDLPDSYYAVQLAAFSDMQKANRYATNAKWLVEPKGVQTKSGSKKYYVILLGVYESKTRAERAAKSISRHVGSDKPWIRSMTSLKPAIKAAN